jgi:hypothetical protein
VGLKAQPLELLADLRCYAGADLFDLRSADYFRGHGFILVTRIPGSGG